MDLFQDIKNYRPLNQQEKCDKEQMLHYMMHNTNYLVRENQTAHFTASIWTVNKERTKTLMVYHNIYDSWSWIGGHADGIEDLRSVAMRELQEETGVENAVLVSPDIFSLELLTVNGHMRKIPIRNPLSKKNQQNPNYPINACRCEQDTFPS